eukprot:CAMPEP_0170524764 /NCGR_PEP_ID=MMETSP0209-20121228/10223_1 /TAXON_ID=665100 ORGANISM="Litonotus pictus, Strain P1" /NCGR_SAMPLE_ID=MMETSP0209 /ASSEMBLY_ACC=CAM_ASM_000301 /LENGTH=42 /DNA_ID= /DNA_START= /DNA_END= /DNA_ORIENTATION=
MERRLEEVERENEQKKFTAKVEDSAIKQKSNEDEEHRSSDNG